MTLDAQNDVDPAGLIACETLAASRTFASIRYVATTDSTNSLALAELDQADSPSTPCLYLADSQTAGRGRHGRVWVSDPGTLTFSLVIPRLAYSALSGRGAVVAPVSIAVGVAIARTIEHLAAPFSARLKWPNDVYLNDRKVAGILIETAPRQLDALVVGVGLNVATKMQDTDASIQSYAISICELTQRYPERYQWLAECVEQIFDALDQCVHSPHEIIAEQRRRCVLRGQMIRYCLADRWLTGQCEGIDDQGALLVRSGETLHRLNSGDVQRVRGVM